MTLEVLTVFYLNSANWNMFTTTCCDIAPSALGGSMVKHVSAPAQWRKQPQLEARPAEC